MPTLRGSVVRATVLFEHAGGTARYEREGTEWEVRAWLAEFAFAPEAQVPTPPNPMRVLRYFDPPRPGEPMSFGDLALIPEFVRDATEAQARGWIVGLGTTFALTNTGAERLADAT